MYLMEVYGGLWRFTEVYVELWNVPIIYSMVLTTHILTRDNMDRPTEIGLPTFYRSSRAGTRLYLAGRGLYHTGSRA